MAVAFSTRYERPTPRTIQRVLYRPTYTSNTSDSRRRETATGGLCAILLHSTGDYRPNDRKCWYNKSNSNTNSNFTNEVRILEKNEFNIPTLLTQSCNEDVFMLQDMFAVESKHSQSESSISFNSPDDLCLGDVITSDGSGAVFAAEIRRRHPGIMFTASLTHSSSAYEQLCLSMSLCCCHS